MRALLAVILLAAGLWSAYWVIGSRSTLAAFERWFDARRAEGWVAEAGTLGVQGFPNRFDVVLGDVILADPATGLAWEAPRFQIDALSYRPNHVIAVWPETQRIATPQEKFRLESQDMRASLVLAPDTALASRRMTLTAEFLRITPEARPEETTALSTLSLAAERLEGAEYRLGLRAEGLTLAAPSRARLDPEGRLPDRIEGFSADVTATFDKPWDRTAIERARPQPTRLRVRLAEGPLGGSAPAGRGHSGCRPQRVARGRGDAQGAQLARDRDADARGGCAPRRPRLERRARAGDDGAAQGQPRHAGHPARVRQRADVARAGPARPCAPSAPALICPARVSPAFRTR